MAACSLVWGLTCPSAHADVTEADFFAEVPVVLTTTRLAQSLFETPGAVTVINRRDILASGARTLADLLRLVPGYIVSGYNGANPLGAYHAPIDEFGTRNLVLVDGRSVYSTTYQGGTTRGMLSVLLEDVERIEVLRGSNSAAFGANAMFGVINVVTRHAEDTLGASVTVRHGRQGVSDAHARFGWQTDAGHHRLSFASRGDDGYRFINDSSRLNALQWRSDLRLAAQQDVFLSGSVTQAAYGDGVNQPTNPDRTVSWEGLHFQGRWKQRISDTAQRSFSFSWDESRNHDEFLVPMLPPVIVDISGRDRRLHLEYQQQTDWQNGVRVVWGVNYKYDSALSPALFFTNDRVSKYDSSVFTNVEWWITDHWLMNAGVFAGHNSLTGSYANPRVMFNYQLSPLQTVRFGWTTAQRAPTLFERFADARLFNTDGNEVRRINKPSPGITPERLRTYEITYLAYLPQWGIELDARIYDERFDRYIVVNRSIPNTQPRDFVNRSGFQSQGFEYQVRWSPAEGTRFIWNQNVNRFRWEDPNETKRVPRQFGSLGWLQALPEDWELSLWVHYRDQMAWRDRLDRDTRVDLHLSRSFRIGDARATGALTIESLNGSRTEFTNARPSVFPRRAFATLHVEF